MALNELMSFKPSDNNQKYHHLKESLYTIGVFICVIIILLNTFVALRVLTARHLRTPYNMLLVNLNIADSLLGITFLVLSVIHLTIMKSIKFGRDDSYNSMYSMLQNNNQDMVLVIYVPIVTAMMVSMLTLTALAAKKYVHIFFPFQYIRLSANLKKSFLVAVLVIWIIAAVFCVLPFILFSYPHVCLALPCKCKHLDTINCMFHRVFRFDYFLVFAVVCATCGVIILILYVRVYLLAHREYNKDVSKRSSLRANHRSRRGEADGNANATPRLGHKVQFEILTKSSSEPQSNENSDEIDPLNSENTTNSPAQNNIDEDNELALKRADEDNERALSDSRFRERQKSIYISSLNINLADLADRLIYTDNIHANFVLNKKALKTILILLIGFYVCWTPLLFYFLYFVDEYDDYTVYILMLLVSCNSIINPIVHALSDKSILALGRRSFSPKFPTIGIA